MQGARDVYAGITDLGPRRLSATGGRSGSGFASGEEADGGKGEDEGQGLHGGLLLQKEDRTLTGHYRLGVDGDNLGMPNGGPGGP